MEKTHPGYDATAGTNDDLTLMTNGEILSPVYWTSSRQSAASIQYHLWDQKISTHHR